MALPADLSLLSVLQLLLFCFLCVMVLFEVLVAILFVIMANGKSATTHVRWGWGKGSQG